MSETKWTPGPWRNRNGLVFDAAGNELGTFWAAPHGPEVRDANAALIASAPDLASRVAELEGEVKRMREAIAQALTPCDLREKSALILRTALAQPEPERSTK